MCLSLENPKKWVQKILYTQNGLRISKLKGLHILLVAFYPSNKIEILSLSLSKFEIPKECLFAVGFEKKFIALNMQHLYGFMKKSG